MSGNEPASTSASGSTLPASISEHDGEFDAKPTSRLTASFISSYSFASSSSQGSESATAPFQPLRRSPRRVSSQPKLEALGARSAPPPRWSVASTPKGQAREGSKGKRKVEDDLDEIRVKKEEPVEAEDSAQIDLPKLNDHLREGIDVMFVGINPGIRSSQTGHHFAHPSNHFYKALHLSGFTRERVPPSLDHTLLNNEPLTLGLTNLCSRPSRNASFLTREEKEQGSPILVAKMRRHRPLLAAFVGKGIGEDFAKCVKGNSRGSIVVRVPGDTPVGGLGLQHFAVAWDAGGDVKPIKKEQGDAQLAESEESKASPSLRATLIFVMPSTSGLVTSHRISDKADCFAQARKLTEWLKHGGPEAEQKGWDHGLKRRKQVETKEIELALIDFGEGVAGS